MNPTQLRLRPILVTSGLLLVLWSVSRQPNWVEGAYATRIYPWIIAILIRLTGWFPFSLAEAVIVLALLGMVGYSLWRMFQLSKGREWRARVILRMVGDGLLLGLVVILLGYALWGLNYARPALAERLGWAPQPRAPQVLAPLLVSLAGEVVGLTNQAYDRCCASSVRVPSGTPIPLAQLDLQVNRGLEWAARQLGLETPS